MLNNRKIIGLCITRLSGQNNYDAMTALNNKVVALGYRLMIFHCSSLFYESATSEDGEARIYENLPYDILDALIVYEETYGNRKIAYNIIKNARKHNIPIFVNGIAHEDCVTFSFDYVGGFERVVRHIIEYHQAKRPFFMAGMPNNEYSDERKAVFANVCEKNNIVFNEDEMVGYGYFWNEPAKKEAEKLLERDILPDAVICANDVMAAAVCEVFTEHGIKIPEEIMISGFDGTPEVYYSNPQITSAACSSEDMAEMIMSYISGIFNGSEYKEERILLLPKLLVLESCGCSHTYVTNGAERISVLTKRLKTYMNRADMITGLASAIQSCKSPEEISEAMKHRWLTNFTVMVSKDCINASELLDINTQNTIPEEFVCIHDDNQGVTGEPFLIKRNEWINHFSEYLEREVPLVFNILHINRCYLGMAVMHSDYLSIEEYYSLYQIVSSLNTAFVGYNREMNQHIQVEQIIELYKTDELTGFYQRKILKNEFTRLVSEAKEKRAYLMVLMLDLDGLKEINDQFGHVEGDNAIEVVADALKSGTPRGTIMLRYGGDELLALYITKADNSGFVRNNIEGYLRRYNNASTLPYTVSASIGMALEKNPGERDIEKLIDMADELMYEEKKQKKVGR